MIQTRHRIPERALREDQIIVYQVPQPEPLSRLEPSRAETRRMHALAEYGLMHVKLYEDIARYGQVVDQLRLSGDGERPLPDVALARSRPSTTRS